MDRSSRVMALKLCVFVAAATALGMATPSNQAAAVSGTAAIGSVSANVGEEASVDVQALGVPQPGLGAWTVDITHDPTVVDFAACRVGDAGGKCGPRFTADTDRIVGASETGLVGDTILATMTYRCAAAGISPLELEIGVFADSTAAEMNYTAVNGSITCVEPSEPTPTEHGSPTATAAPSLPPTGTGRASGNSAGWLIAVLAGAGVAALAFLGALRLRARRP